MQDKKSCCFCSNQTLRDDKAKHDLIVRLNRIEGQIRGIKNMIENDAYCADVLVQSAAATAALNGFNKQVIEGHIKGCVTRDIKQKQKGLLKRYGG